MMIKSALKYFALVVGRVSPLRAGAVADVVAPARPDQIGNAPTCLTPTSGSWANGQTQYTSYQHCRLAWVQLLWLMLAIAYSVPKQVLAEAKSPQPDFLTSGIEYTNYRVAREPWSIHVVRVARNNPTLELHSMHSGGKAIGLSTLSEQVARVPSQWGTPIAAISGDFYSRSRTYAGDPHGLQIVDGEVISAPSDRASFWADNRGGLYTTNVTSFLRIIWPNGTTTPCGLNQERRANTAVLYTAALGRSTFTTSGREFVLEQPPNGPWLPLRMAEVYAARVRSIRDTGNTPLATNVLVLSLGPALGRQVPNVETGAVIGLQMGSVPALRDVKTALSGGPVLVRYGKRQKVPTSYSDSDDYRFSSMTERHPRAAMGWNKNYFYLVAVDGRQPRSEGMTLDELAAYFIQLGCEEAMNLDGGGSATLWYQGKVRNRPCDGYERDIANSLVVVRKP